MVYIICEHCNHLVNLDDCHEVKRKLKRDQGKNTIFCAVCRNYTRREDLRFVDIEIKPYNK